MPESLLRTPLLTALRTCPQPSPARFLRHQPGSWILLRPDDLAVRRYRPVLWREVDSDELERLQGEGWGVHFTAQAFGPTLAAADLLCLRTLVVDVAVADEGEGLTPLVLDRRKEQTLRRLAAFPLRPHWLIETRLGGQALFRVLPPGDKGPARFLEVQERLNAVLGGKATAGVLQMVRLPGTLQFGRRGPPFLCRLLENQSASIPPYPLDDVEAVLARHSRGKVATRPFPARCRAQDDLRDVATGWGSSVTCRRGRGLYLHRAIICCLVSNFSCVLARNVV